MSPVIKQKRDLQRENLQTLHEGLLIHQNCIMESYRYFRMLNKVVKSHDFPPCFINDSRNTVGEQVLGYLRVRVPLHPFISENSLTAGPWLQEKVSPSSTHFLSLFQLQYEQGRKFFKKNISSVLTKIVYKVIFDFSTYYAIFFYSRIIFILRKRLSCRDSSNNTVPQYSAVQIQMTQKYKKGIMLVSCLFKKTKYLHSYNK